MELQKLCKVKQRHYEDNRPLAVGDILVRNGAWQRKYEVVAITEIGKYGDYQTEYTVELRVLGNFYATGRMVPSKKQPSTEVRAVAYDDKPLYGPNGYIVVDPAE